MGNKIELYKQFNQKQEKFTYYLIALSIAAIGYTIHQTKGVGFEITQIPLGLAVLSWGTSAYLGLWFIRLMTSTVFTNMGFIDMSSGKDPIAGDDPQKINFGRQVLSDIIKSNSKKGMKLHKWQNRLFYLGMFLYLGWHLYNMYLLTVN